MTHARKLYRDCRHHRVSSMRTLLIAMAAVEISAGLGLIAAPSWVTWLLLGSSLGTPVALMIARLAGLALICLGAVCWFASRHEGSGMSAGLMAAMSLYNIGAAALLAYAGIGLGLTGPGLWPALLGHLVFAAGCIGCGARVQAALGRQ